MSHAAPSPLYQAWKKANRSTRISLVTETAQTFFATLIAITQMVDGLAGNSISETRLGSSITAIAVAVPIAVLATIGTVYCHLIQRVLAQKILEANEHQIAEDYIEEEEEPADYTTYISLAIGLVTCITSNFFWLSSEWDFASNQDGNETQLGLSKTGISIAATVTAFLAFGFVYCNYVFYRHYQQQRELERKYREGIGLEDATEDRSAAMTAAPTLTETLSSLGVLQGIALAGDAIGHMFEASASLIFITYLFGGDSLDFRLKLFLNLFALALGILGAGAETRSCMHNLVEYNHKLADYDPRHADDFVTTIQAAPRKNLCKDLHPVELVAAACYWLLQALGFASTMSLAVLVSIDTESSLSYQNRLIINSVFFLAGIIGGLADTRTRLAPMLNQGRPELSITFGTGGAGASASESGYELMDG